MRSMGLIERAEFPNLWHIEMLWRFQSGTLPLFSGS